LKEFDKQRRERKDKVMMMMMNN